MGEGSQKGSSVGVARITWAELWSSIVEYVVNEGDAIRKLEKQSISSSGETFRQNRKTVRISAKTIELPYGG